MDEPAAVVVDGDDGDDWDDGDDGDDWDDGNDWDDEPCEHEHDEECYDYQGFYVCRHSHCVGCGGCTCPGYCDDFQTYNLRPAETGGAESLAGAM